MKGKYPVYVVDTNILVDYPDLIPSTDGMKRRPENPTIDLSKAHIVIPSAVTRELSSFKNEKSDRGKAARLVLGRIRALVEGRTEHSLDDIYRMKDGTEIEVGEQTFTILPVHKNFKSALPFAPSETDMDGQIILATLTVEFNRLNKPIDGTATTLEVGYAKCSEDKVVLLTNDNGLAIRAYERGIKTSRYSQSQPEPYTGRRKVKAPRSLCLEFYNCSRIERVDFEAKLENEPKLVANEFIELDEILDPEYAVVFDEIAKDRFQNVGRYDAEEDAIVSLRYALDFPVYPRNVGQAIYAEALMDPNISAVVCTGPAGSGKTFMATVFGYHACRDGDFIGVTVVPCENQGRLGALPGDLDEKMDPDVQPLKNALRNYLLMTSAKLSKALQAHQKFGAGKSGKKARNAAGEDDEPIEKGSIKSKTENQVNLIWENWFSSVPIEHARGRDFSYELAIYDEFQDQNVSQADTLIKRIGANGKIILTGDIRQIHAPYLDATNNGLTYASSLLKDHPMVAQVCFTEDEVIRHQLVKMVAKRQKDGLMTPPQ